MPAMSASHEVDFSSKKDGFDNYRMDSVSSWCIRDDDYVTPWLLMTFQSVIKIYGFGIGGPSNATMVSYPSNFKVFTKLTDWQSCRVKNTDWLPGVYKPGDVVYHYLDSPHEAMQVKFVFHGHTAHPKCARVDIKGCEIDYCNDYRPCQNGATCMRSKKNGYLCHCPLGYEGKNCQFATKIGICIPPLGVDSPAIIPDDRITAATAIGGFEPKYARLNEQVKAYCAWPSQDGTLTITFDSPTLVLSLQMRGHPTDLDWVTKFQVRAAGQWLDLTGNTEQGDQTIWRPFFNNETSMQFSITPIESKMRRCMRVELFGINE
ncbi:EGF-like repeat and discoidin I-like domain-containing 3, partial [Paramuricea clavata]